MQSKPTFRATPVTIRTPASSANLGAGFDCLGLALEIYDGYAAQVSDEAGLDIQVAGEGADEIRKDDKNLVIKAMNRAFDHMGGKPRGLSVRALNAIPHGRGLGSSSSAIIGGLYLARALVISGQERLTDQDLLAIATEMEGHPDNVAAALYGGATIAWLEGGVGRATPITVNHRINAVAFIPESAVATSSARKMLPDEVLYKDATANIARSALMVEALSNKPEFLYEATQDLIHQEFRKSAMPKSFALVQKLRSAGVAAFISGAGPTVLALHTGSVTDAQEIARAGGSSFATSSFATQILGISRVGAHIYSPN
jgi:homoserine kinase